MAHAVCVSPAAFRFRPSSGLVLGIGWYRSIDCPRVRRSPTRTPGTPHVARGRGHVPRPLVVRDVGARTRTRGARERARPRAGNDTNGRRDRVHKRQTNPQTQSADRARGCVTCASTYNHSYAHAIAKRRRSLIRFGDVSHDPRRTRLSSQSQTTDSCHHLCTELPLC